MAARRRAATPVLLNVYDLSPANDFTYSFGMGVHHSGVEISGTEYTFASGGGVFEHTPREAPGAKYRETIHMGDYAGSSSDLRVVVSDLRGEWGGDSYNILTRNCNSFANELCLRLLNRPLPPHVNRLAYLGSFFSCCLPPDALGAAPVDNGGGGGGGGSGGGRAVVRAPPTHVAYEGSGLSLGGSGAPTGAAAAVPSEGAAGGDGRREMMRQAAMARMARQQQERQAKKQEQEQEKGLLSGGHNRGR